jgi:addiction module HigA family antidote
MTQRELAESIEVPYQRINEIVNGRRGITLSAALRLSRYFGTSSGIWMNSQMRWDLYHAQQPEGDQARQIRGHPRALSEREASA